LGWEVLDRLDAGLEANVALRKSAFKNKEEIDKSGCFSCGDRTVKNRNFLWKDDVNVGR